MPPELGEFCGHEWRLMHVLALNALVIVALWRLVRRRLESDGLAAGLWTTAGWLLVQYVSVAVPALLGVLNAWTMTVAGCVLAGGAWLLAGRPWGKSEIRNPKPESSSRGGFRKPNSDRPSRMPAVDYYIAWGTTLFLFGYLLAVFALQWQMPPMGDDGLTYHLPAAVRWLQEGRFVLHEVWFLNPAATFNPLLGSALAAWWMAPMGNDFLAKWVQAPGLVLLFFAIIQACRALGARPALASLVALAAVLSRPFVSQVIVVKDDLYLTGFFVLIVGLLGREHLRRPPGPWKLGLALGLFLATKVTALMALPMLALAIDAPFRAGWRWKHWLIASGLALLLAGPWYGYNWWLTGNPVYPADMWIGGVHVFEGIFRMERSLELGSVGGAWHVLTGKYFSIAPWLLGSLVAGWGVVFLWEWRRVVREAMVRVVMIGPVIGMAIYLAMSQFPEVRYAYPVFALLYVAFAVMVGIVSERVGVVLGAGLAAGSAVTGFARSEVILLLLIALLIAVGGLAVVWAQRRWARAMGGVLMVARVALAVGLFMGILVYQNAVIAAYRQTADAVWEMSYGPLGEAWTFARGELPGGTTIAYSNTCLMYPLFGFGWEHGLAYAPTRRGIKSLRDLPRVREGVPGERIVELVVAPLAVEPDKSVWVENLRATGAQYLFVVKEARGLRAVELSLLENDSRFQALYENEAAGLWQIKW